MRRLNKEDIGEYSTNINYDYRICSKKNGFKSNVGPARYVRSQKQLNTIQYARNIHIAHWRSQNAEKVMHIKGRLLGQAVVQFNCVPFYNGNFS